MVVSMDMSSGLPMFFKLKCIFCCGNVGRALRFFERNGRRECVNHCLVHCHCG